MTQQEFNDLIEELEYELEQAKDLLRQAQEDDHAELIKKAKREIREWERKIINTQYEWRDRVSGN